MSELATWRVAGSYYETCNCEAVCPCRRLNGEPGGRSTYGVCRFLLSWRIVEGRADGVDLSGRSVAMAGFYDDDEQGSPWTVVLYIDAGADSPAFEALAAIFLGDAGGTHFFATKVLDVIAVRQAHIHLDHSDGKETVAVRDAATAAVEGRPDYDGSVTCAIPGHNQVGRELISKSAVRDGPLDWSYEGRCGFASAFDYRSQ